MSLLDQAIEVPSGGSLLDQAIDVEDSSFAAEMAEQKRRNKESLRQHKIAEFQDLPFYQRLPAVAAVGAMKGGFDVLSLGNRIASAVGPAGMGQFSDDVNAAMAESPLAGGRFVDESIEGATRSLSKAIPIGMAGGGRYGIIAEAGLTAANQAYTKARRAGKSQAAALAYATTSGVIEAGITTLLPGQEALIAKNKGLVGGVTQWVKRTLMGIGGELPQEAAIAYAQGAADVGFGVDPSALSAESRGRAARSVIGQTLAGGAGIAGVQALTPPAHGAIAEQARVDRAQPDIEARRSQFVTPENVRYVLNSLRETGQSDGLEALDLVVAENRRGSRLTARAGFAQAPQCLGVFRQGEEGGFEEASRLFFVEAEQDADLSGLLDGEVAFAVQNQADQSLADTQGPGKRPGGVGGVVLLALEVKTTKQLRRGLKVCSGDSRIHERMNRHL